MTKVLISGGIELGLDVTETYSGDDLKKITFSNIYDLVLEDIKFRIDNYQGLANGAESGRDEFNYTDEEVYEYLEKRKDTLEIVECYFDDVSYDWNVHYYDYTASLNVTSEDIDNYYAKH